MDLSRRGRGTKQQVKQRSGQPPKSLIGDRRCEHEAGIGTR